MLRTNLEKLERADLIRRTQFVLEIEYWFKHGLVQETTYEALLKQDRRRLHHFVAEILEHWQDDSALTAVLARHWDEAGESARAFGYYVRTGDNAARVYANKEALMAYQRAIELSETLELSPAQLAHLYIQCGRVHELNAQYDAALASYDALEQVALARQDSALALEALLARISIYATPNARFDFERAIELAQQAIVRARELKDRAAEAKALWLLLLVYSHSNRPRDAMPKGEAALALARELNLRELTAYILNDLGGVYISEGDFASGLALLQEANQLWRELDNLPMLADNLSSRAGFLIYAGEMDAVLQLSDEAYHITERIGNLWGQSYSLFAVGVAHLERGEFTLAIAKMQECIAVGERAGFIAPRLDTQLDLGRAYLWLGETQRAIEVGEQTLKDIAGFPLGLPLCYAALVEFYAAAGDLTRAQEHLHNARETLAQANNLLVYEMYVERAALLLAVARGDWQTVRTMCAEFISQMERIHVRLFLADVWYYLARALFELGNANAGFDALARADAVAQAIGSRRMRWQILALRAEMEQAHGNHLLADESREHARGLLRFIADNAPVELRKVFLNRPDVRALMEKDE